MALEDEGRLTLIIEDSPISTRLGGPREPPSDLSIGRPRPRLDKGKAKMSKYEDTNDNTSTHSLNSESEGLDISNTQMAGAQKTLEYANLHRSSREKDPVSRFAYNDYIAYHYAYMMKVTSVREPETFSEAAKDSRWVAAVNEEMEALCKNETWDLVPPTPHKKEIESKT